MTDIEHFHRAIGRFVLSWADLEVGLDLLALTIRAIRSHSEQAPQLKFQLDEKLKFVREEIRSLPQLHAYAGRIRELLKEIEDLSDTRNDYVHGAAIDHKFGRPSTITLGRLLQPRSGRRRSVKVTVRGIDDISNRVWSIGGALLDLAALINKLAED